MATRTLALTDVLTLIGGSPRVGAPVSVYLLTPGGTPVVNLEGKVLFNGQALGGESTVTDATGTWTETVVYVGDLRDPVTGNPAACQYVISEAGNVTVSPVGFAYAASVTVSTWYASASTAGTLRMILTADTVANAPNQGVALRFDITANAVKPDYTAITAGSAITATTDASGNVAINQVPTGLLNPTTTSYILTLPGGDVWYYTVPQQPTGYQGAYSSGTAYHVNGGAADKASPADVVLSGGVYYQAVADSTGQAVTNTAYWTPWPGEPITFHLVQVTTAGGVVIDPTGVRAGTTFTPLAGDPIPAPLTLDDQLVDMAAETRARLRYTGAWSSAVAYLANDVALSGGIDYIALAPSTNQVPPNTSYWVALGGAGGGTGNVVNPMPALDDLIVGGPGGIPARLPSDHTPGHVLQQDSVTGHLTWGPVSGSAGGTVTSVSASAPSFMSVSVGTPTSTPAIALSFSAQAQNTFLAGPTTGTSTGPTFRTIVPLDLPIASASQRGAVQVDGTTIVITSGGVISAAASGSTLASLGDAAISTPHDGDLLRYSSADGKWHNIDPTAPGAGGIYWAPMTDSAGNLIVDASGSCIMMPAAV